MIYYVAIPVSEVTNTLLNASTSHLIEQTRISNDGLQCILKFDTDTSAQYFIDREWLNKAEIDVLMEDPDWA